MAKTRKTPGRRPKTAAASAKKAPGVELTEGDRDLLRRLSERAGVEAQEVLERALAGYAATAAPGMPLHPEPARNAGKGEPPQKLFLSGGRQAGGGSRQDGVRARERGRRGPPSRP